MLSSFFFPSKLQIVRTDRIRNSLYAEEANFSHFSLLILTVMQERGTGDLLEVPTGAALGSGAGGSGGFGVFWGGRAVSCRSLAVLRTGGKRGRNLLNVELGMHRLGYEGQQFN